MYVLHRSHVGLSTPYKKLNSRDPFWKTFRRHSLLEILLMCEKANNYSRSMMDGYYLPATPTWVQLNIMGCGLWVWVWVNVVCKQKVYEKKIQSRKKSCKSMKGKSACSCQSHSPSWWPLKKSCVFYCYTSDDTVQSFVTGGQYARYSKCTTSLF